MPTQSAKLDTAVWTRSNAMKIRAKAWTGYGITSELAHVHQGQVWLFDTCASQFTSVHALSKRAIARIIAKYKVHCGDVRRGFWLKAD